MEELTLQLIHLIGSIVGFFLLVWLVTSGRVLLASFQYHMEDTTTGFLTVRNRVQWASAAATAALLEESRTAEDSPFSLALGAEQDSGFGSPFVLPGNYRDTHMYIVGASGSGKSSLLKNLLVQDIQNGMGLAVLDPHGDLVLSLLPHLGKRMSSTYLLDLEDSEHMLAYNPLQKREDVLVAEQVAKLILAFQRIWADAWGARMEDILRHTLSLLVEQEYTLYEFERVLTDTDFRNMLVERSKLHLTREYFEHRFNEWNSKERQMYTESSLNKVSAFLADPRIGARLGQPKSGFNLREIMDRGEILLVNLGKGKLAGNADLFGALLLADIEMSFLSRKENRSKFALYVDEFQNIATESFATVLAEARKFGLCLTLAHQSLRQVDPKLISHILGNAQTQVYFRVAREDAERLAKESHDVMEQLRIQEDEVLMQAPKRKFSLGEMWEIAFHALAGLPQRHAYVMVKGALQHPVQIRTTDMQEGKAATFAYSEDFQSMAQLEQALTERKGKLEEEIREFAVRDRNPMSGL